MHNSIYKYIAIRPEIKKHLIKNFKIDENEINILYNPFDFNKFNTNNISDENFILFVGSLENLRKKPLYDIMEYANNNNKELWIVGKNHSNYLDELLKNNHVKYFNSCENIETFVKKCSETAGILLGRTTIEGWLCGKLGWIYNVDNEGNILNKDKHLPPNDLTKFNSIEVAKKTKKLYIKALS
jgi:glycosyltransferase involved in cell wall biosynthesis